MKKNTILLLVCMLLNCFCTGNPKQTKGNKKADANGMDKLDVFSECTNHDNNLSTVASEVKFVHLGINPPIDEFRIYDVAIGDEYIFLSGLTHIAQYGHNGEYIKNIGSHGRGPEEFFKLGPPVQLDQKNRLIYALDMTYKKIVVYDFDGKFVKKIPIGFDSICFELINSSIIALRQTIDDRYSPDCQVIRFIDHDGKQIKDYPSHLYPLPIKRFETFGSSESFLWKHNNKRFYLEYGADTIYQIKKDSLIPSRIITGKLRLDKDELFRREIKSNKLDILNYILRPNAGIFESDNFIVFKLSSKKETFYKVYNKSTMLFHRTFHENAPSTRRGTLKMEYFTDDIVSGLPFNPRYQSRGKAMSLIPAMDIYNRKQEILDFIAGHPSEEAEGLRSIVQNINETDNPILMIVNFK